jgi:uncharacterized protein (DUF849 family)
MARGRSTIIQCCRSPRARIAEDAVACIAAGANEIHVHPRGSDGQESLHAIDETVAELRKHCPGTLIGVSTGEWIENDADRTIAAIESWTEPPDYASVNLVEDDAPRVMETLAKCDVGIEAGLATAADAERLVTLDRRAQGAAHPDRDRRTGPPGAGFAVADAIEDVLARKRDPQIRPASRFRRDRLAVCGTRFRQPAIDAGRT